MSALIINANALNIPLADKSVQCVVTSPPYCGIIMSMKTQRDEKGRFVKGMRYSQ